MRVDLGVLLRGYAIEGEVCEIAGFGPVAVSAVRDMIDTDDPFLTAVVTKGQKLLGVAHLGRRPNALQQTALQWLYPSCANEACSARARLDYDHRLDWSRTHFTVFDLLDRLCPHCHALKTRQNWSLVEGRGKRACPAGRSAASGERGRTGAQGTAGALLMPICRRGGPGQTGARAARGPEASEERCSGPGRRQREGPGAAMRPWPGERGGEAVRAMA